MNPIISRKGIATQLSYELPHRAFVAKVYPVKAPNGSTIIIYGYETGLRILWRGGRRLKQHEPTTTKAQSRPQPNGTGNDAIMLIDSDEEETTKPKASQQFKDEVEFDSEEEELDQDAPYPSIIQQLDLSLDTEVLDIAVPRIPSVTKLRPADAMPQIFGQKIVFSVACGDCKTRVITLPLSPPSDAGKSRRNLAQGETRFGEDILDLGGHSVYRSAPTSLAITWTSRNPAAFKEEDVDIVMVDGDHTSPRRRRRGSGSRNTQSRSRSAGRSEAHDWDLLISAHYPEMTGLLHIYRVPLASDRIYRALLRGPPFPEQTQYLRSPASHIAFSPSLHPNKRHSQLLVVDPKGAVRIYDSLSSPRARPGSAREESSEAPADLGKWLVTLHTSFEVPKQSDALSPGIGQRKHILDARWATDGRSVIALLADGEWGIWDIEQSGPTTARTASTAPANPLSFALHGYLSKSNNSSTSGIKPRNKGTSLALAPMTPNTRRTKEESLFHGHSSSTPSALGRGGISVASLASETGGVSEDSVVVWYDSDAYRIPNLAQFWSRNSQAGSNSELWLSRIEGLTTYGEFITGMDQFDTTMQAARLGVPRDVLVVAEHRLLFLSSSPTPERKRLALFEKEEGVKEQARKVDQHLLARGELDLGGMDRLLDGLASGTRGAEERKQLSFGRKVGFAT